MGSSTTHRQRLAAAANRSAAGHSQATAGACASLFGAVLHLLDIPLMIERVHTPFPDCLARRTDTKELVRIEFEVYGRHFKQHRHNEQQCDMLVCWKDGWGKWRKGFEVVELYRVVKEKCRWIIETIRDHEPGVSWNEETFFQRCGENGLTGKEIDAIRSMIRFAEAEGLGPYWLDNAVGTFVVGDGRQFFKVHADGKIAFPFIRLKCGDLFPDLFRRLNQAFDEKLFEMGDEKRKKGKRPVLVREFCQAPKRLRAFLNVWKWFASIER
jgi:hypothetical protein